MEIYVSYVTVTFSVYSSLDVCSVMMNGKGKNNVVPKTMKY